jgi:hypothetical protein
MQSRKLYARRDSKHNGGGNRAKIIRRRTRALVEAMEQRVFLSGSVTIQDSPTGIFPQFDFADPNPNSGGEFGYQVVPLSTGNVVVTDPTDNAGGTDAGAVYLFNGTTGALISTITGSVNDLVGNEGIVALSNGNFVIDSPEWSGGNGTDLGAVTWGSGATGVSGVVSASNSIVGSTPSDSVGSSGIKALTNGDFVIGSSNWSNGGISSAGAATWADGTTGQSITGFGAVSAANSLVGSTSGDYVGGNGITPLKNGNYVVDSNDWQNGNSGQDWGAVTWGNGTGGTVGAVSASNSLVGGTAGDGVGSNGITVLTNGNYVVRNPDVTTGLSHLPC